MGTQEWKIITLRDTPMPKAIKAKVPSRVLAVEPVKATPDDKTGFGGAFLPVNPAQVQYLEQRAELAREQADANKRLRDQKRKQEIEESRKQFIAKREEIKINRKIEETRIALIDMLDSYRVSHKAVNMEYMAKVPNADTITKHHKIMDIVEDFMYDFADKYRGNGPIMAMFKRFEDEMYGIQNKQYKRMDGRGFDW